MKKIDIAALPELDTGVSIHGSSKQKEVAGPVCLGAVVAAFFWTTGRNPDVWG